jgi:hypothetical protein
VIDKRHGDQYCDDEPTVVEANLDPGDSPEFDLCAQCGTLATPNILISEALDAGKIGKV